MPPASSIAASSPPTGVRGGGLIRGVLHGVAHLPSLAHSKGASRTDTGHAHSPRVGNSGWYDFWCLLRRIDFLRALKACRGFRCRRCRCLVLLGWNWFCGCWVNLGAAAAGLHSGHPLDGRVCLGGAGGFGSTWCVSWNMLHVWRWGGLRRGGLGRGLLVRLWVLQGLRGLLIGLHGLLFLRGSGRGVRGGADRAPQVLPGQLVVVVLVVADAEALRPRLADVATGCAAGQQHQEQRQQRQSADPPLSLQTHKGELNTK